MKGRKRKQGRFCASEGISQGCKPSPGTRSDWSTFKAAHDTDNGHSNEGAISAPHQTHTEPKTHTKTHIDTGTDVAPHNSNRRERIRGKVRNQRLFCTIRDCEKIPDGKTPILWEQEAERSSRSTRSLKKSLFLIETGSFPLLFTFESCNTLFVQADGKRHCTQNPTQKPTRAGKPTPTRRHKRTPTE